MQFPEANRVRIEPHRRFFDGNKIGDYALDKPPTFWHCSVIGGFRCPSISPIRFSTTRMRPARYFEALHWPNGAGLPALRRDRSRPRSLKGEAHRSGLYKCRACDEQFSVTVGTVMESSHVPLHKWALAFRLMAGTKKGVSAHQLMRELGLGSYRTAWFWRIAFARRWPIATRSRSAARARRLRLMRHSSASRTMFRVSGKGWQGKRGTATKRKVLTMVERGGRAVSVKVEDLTVATLKKVIGARSF